MPFELKNHEIEILKLNLPVKKARRSERIETTDIHFRLEGGNALLNLLDATLRPMFYKAVETATDRDKAKQQALEGVEVVSEMPLLWSSAIRYPVRLSLELTGYAMTIDRGLGDHTRAGKPVTSNIVASEVTVKSISVSCKEGGSVVIDAHAQSTTVKNDDLGPLRALVKCKSRITLEAPKVRQQVIDASKDAVQTDAQREAAAALEGDLKAGAPAAPTSRLKGGGAKPPAPKAGKPSARAAREAAEAAFAGGAAAH